eukprot:4430030-Alexandrium_andersonii.AAC.1
MLLRGVAPGGGVGCSRQHRLARAAGVAGPPSARVHGARARPGIAYRWRGADGRAVWARRLLLARASVGEALCFGWCTLAASAAL